MHRKVVLALVAALALGLAGCGGSERTETVSRAELVHRLEAACRAGQSEAKREMRGRSGSTAFSQAIQANLQKIIDEVGDLESTGTAKAAFDAYKATVRTRLDALARIAAADGRDRTALVVAERATIERAGIRAHAAIVRLGARHICL